MFKRYCVEAADVPGGSGTVYFTPLDQKIQGRLGREIMHGFYCTGTISVVRLSSLACTAPCGNDGYLYMYGPDPDRLYVVVSPILKSSTLMNNAEVTKLHAHARKRS
jgi:hypothetical protein